MFEKSGDQIGWRLKVFGPWRFKKVGGANPFFKFKGDNFTYPGARPAPLVEKTPFLFEKSSNKISEKSLPF